MKRLHANRSGLSDLWDVPSVNCRLDVCRSACRNQYVGVRNMIKAFNGLFVFAAEK